MRFLSASVLIPTVVVGMFLVSLTVSSAQRSREITEDDLRLFLDDFFERELPVHKVVGAGVVVVYEGRVVAARGYGYSDREAKRPVQAESTLFPAQSVSKLFAATAVMQLYEQGLVDLHADIRKYLGDVSLDSDFAEPVTLAHLLTHTAGLDDSYIGLLPRASDDILPVPEFLNRYRRRVVFPPGTVHAYSNYGSLLARHVVQVVTGTDYEDYVVEEILRPLGMNQTCVLPPPPEWVDRLATGYLPAGEGLESTRNSFPNGLIRFHTKTGTLASTVVDMARFMIAHLEDGAFDGGRILEPETLRLMHGQQFAQHPRVPGATYGFFESTVGNERGIFHFGEGFGYGTLLYLLPERNIGFYIAHSNSSARITDRFVTAFLEHFFDHPRRVVAASTETFDTDATHFAGYYVPVRRPETTFEKLPFMLIQANLRAADGETLANDQLLPREWVRTGSLTFERANGGGIMAFTEDAEGRPNLVSIWDEELPQLLVLERVPRQDSAPLLLTRLGWFVVVFLTIVLAYPIGALVRRRQSSSVVKARIVSTPLFGAAVLNVAFLLGLAWTFLSRDWFYSVSPVLMATFSLPLVAMGFTGLALVRAIRGRDELAGRTFARLLQGLTLLTLVLFPLFLWRWNLIGFHF